VSEEGYVLLFGGSSNSSLLNDLWNIKLNFQNSKEDVIRKRVLPGITGALMVIVFVGAIISLAIFFNKQSNYQ